jgi:hypothetical protein
VIATNAARVNYLNRNYPHWNERLHMIMDHRANVYFDEPIECPSIDHIVYTLMIHLVQIECPQMRMKYTNPMQY